MAGACAAVASMTTSTYSPVTITDRTVSHVVADPADATAAYTLTSGGLVQDHTGATLETWLGSGAASNYEVRATVTAGALSTGLTGSWLALSSNRTWTRSRTIVGTGTATLLIEIRDTATSTVQDSATISLEAEVTS